MLDPVKMKRILHSVGYGLSLYFLLLSYLVYQAAQRHPDLVPVASRFKFKVSLEVPAYTVSLLACYRCG